MRRQWEQLCCRGTVLPALASKVGQTRGKAFRRALLVQNPTRQPHGKPNPKPDSRKHPTDSPTQKTNQKPNFLERKKPKQKKKHFTKDTPFNTSQVRPRSTTKKLNRCLESQKGYDLRNRNTGKCSCCNSSEDD